LKKLYHKFQNIIIIIIIIILTVGLWSDWKWRRSS